MSKKVIIVFTIAIAAMLLFTACERSASQPILATPTAESSNATSQSTSLSLVQQWGTSTAIYIQTAEAMGLITPGPTSETPQASLAATQAEKTVSTSVVPPTGAPTATAVPGTTPEATKVTTPVVIVPTATPGRPATYTLHEGEFPYCLARRFDVNPDDLLSLNSLVNGQNLQPGLTLSIPQTGSYPGTRARNPHPAQYTVAVGDTFYSIACYFGDVDPTSIAAANGLSMSTTLTAGQTLNIP
ncbi:MAG: LysM peptidoglycan-binding domain-containing protein [Anaerolineales bacterium]|jgi:LysM repeat protein